MKPARIAVFACSMAAAATAVAGCSSSDAGKAAPTSVPATTTKATSTMAGFPEPPPYTLDIQGKDIRVATTSADPTDLLNTYNQVARTLQVSLPEGGYFVQINCATGGTDNRLANGTLAFGKQGLAQIGGVGKFEGAVPGAHCP
ncbi:hypothetical protein ACFXHA_17635 [Nocardia sp. NPDC059240]|uniref:hypothetical protein n=1 Tax=Nocardia sp. NPDC059240 TaxID=3346786 RepID=UPI0036CE1E3A